MECVRNCMQLLRTPHQFHCCVCFRSVLVLVLPCIPLGPPASSIATHPSHRMTPPASPHREYSHRHSMTDRTSGSKMAAPSVQARLRASIMTRTMLQLPLQASLIQKHLFKTLNNIYSTYVQSCNFISINKVLYCGHNKDMVRCHQIS